MEQDEKTKQDLASKRRRAAGVGGRTAQFIATTGHRYTPEQARDAVQKSHMAQRLKREQQRQVITAASSMPLAGDGGSVEGQTRRREGIEWLAWRLWKHQQEGMTSSQRL